MAVEQKHIVNNVVPSFIRILKIMRAALALVVERFRSASLRFKFAFFVVVLLNGAFIGLFSITAQIMDDHVLNEIVRRGESVCKNVSLAAEGLSSGDLSRLNSLVLRAKSSNNDIEYVSIVTPDQRTIAHSEIASGGGVLPVIEGRPVRKNGDGTTVRELMRPSDSIIEIAYPIVFTDKSTGNITLAVNKSVLFEAQDKIRARIFIVFGIILVLGTVASVFMTSFLIKPINELSIGVDELKRGNAKTPLKIHSQDELGRLTMNFNEMSSTIQEQRDKLGEYARDLEEAYISIVKVVAAAIDARDSYTHGHSGRVSQFSMLIGQAIGLSKEELDDLQIACLFHDVGKIKTPDSILLKSSKLNQFEYKEMIHHVEDGAAILDKAPSLRKHIPAVRHHHERYDGKGYPDGLSGENIPLFASIIAVADTFDAMTSTRSYRKAFPVEIALQELTRVAGTQLRPDLVNVFVELIEQNSIDDVQSAADGVQ